MQEYKHVISNKYPLFDVNNFMNEVDILLNDYSATSTDFALLNRPQLFCMPDYDKYWNYEGVSFIPIDDSNTKYKETLPGEEVLNYNQLINTIKYIDDNYEDYLIKYKIFFKLRNNKDFLLFPKNLITICFDLSKNRSYTNSHPARS